IKVTLLVLPAKNFEGPFAIRDLVDWCTGETNVSGARQRRYQIVTKIAPGRPVGFIDEHHDVFTRVDVLGDPVELVNHRDYQPSVTGLEQSLKMRPRLYYFNISDAITL